MTDLKVEWIRNVVLVQEFWYVILEHCKFLWWEQRYTTITLAMFFFFCFLHGGPHARDTVERGEIKLKMYDLFKSGHGHLPMLVDASRSSIRVRTLMMMRNLNMQKCKIKHAEMNARV